MQERRMIELVALGDYHTAVGFLLASPPERSARYYRDALCTLALAHAAAALPDGRSAAVAGAPPGGPSGNGTARAAAEQDAEVDRGTSNAASLLWQVRVHAHLDVCMTFALQPKSMVLCGDCELRR